MSGQPPSEDRSAGPAELLGRTIAGKFVVEAVIGTGAMGVVYRARQTALDKVVAIKVMHGGLLADESFAARFHREAKAASRLDHPNSIRILDFGQEPDGRLYIAMDYLDGRDLLEVINHEWPLSTLRMVDMLAQALSALAVAHDLGILHRDLKPENIMVLRGKNDDGSPADLVKVCDFGIAKIIERDDDPANTREKLSTGGIVVGTPAYMAPEQARGETLDLRCDVYAVGVILYQMLTMRVPFDAPTPLSTLLRLVNEEPPLPSSVSSYVDPRLEEVCLKAMSKKPEDRYQGAREMRAALRSITEGGRAAGETAPAASAESRRALQAAPTTSLPVLHPGRGADAKPRSARSWNWIAAGAGGAAALAVLATQMRGSLTTGSLSLPSEAPPIEVPPGTEPSHIETTPQPTAVTGTATAPSPTTASGARTSGATASENPPPSKVRTPNPVHVPEPARAEVAATNVAGVVPPPLASASPAASSAAPATPPAQRVPAVATATAVAPRPIDPAGARVDVGSASNTVGTTAANVNKAIGPATSRLVACYRASLAGGVVNDGPATLHLETNDEGVVTEARLVGRIAPPLAGCITGAVRGRKIANVDTGSASADVPLVFRSR